MTAARIALLILAATVAPIIGMTSYYRFKQQMLVTYDDTAQADVVIALTGGRGRLDAAVKLLKEGRADNLFVSGVNREVDIEQLAESIVDLTPALRKKIQLGYGAANTFGNSREVLYMVRSKGLLRGQPIKAIIVVTNFYHMPRAMLELAAVVPEVTLYPYPVFPRDFDEKIWFKSYSNVKLALSEWMKYYITKMRMVILQERNEG
jgi:uncharacterized SAM-binding protein YcdF (DUF218 family)